MRTWHHDDMTSQRHDITTTWRWHDNMTRWQLDMMTWRLHDMTEDVLSLKPLARLCTWTIFSDRFWNLNPHCTRARLCQWCQWRHDIKMTWRRHDMTSPWRQLDITTTWHQAFLKSLNYFKCGRSTILWKMYSIHVVYCIIHDVSLKKMFTKKYTSTDSFWGSFILYLSINY